MSLNAEGGLRGGQPMSTDVHMEALEIYSKVTPYFTYGNNAR